MVFLRHVSVALSAAAATLGSALFLALNFFYQRKLWSPQAEYSMLTEESRAEDKKQQVLVLGLDGAGKSSLLHCLTLGGGAPGGVARPGHRRPTRGFNFMSLRGSAHQLDFLEIGGDQELRCYWLEYLRKTDILVYVVDASDRQRLPLARQELQLLLKMERHLPVVVLANKQDQADALGVTELHEGLSLGSVTQDRRLFLLATQLGNSAVGLEALQDLLLKLH
ncbi:ADP-ribosylation factor-like 10 isoform X2 [Gadus morhua]|uniref:ADP-ribosylation factor-like 10 n=2 Tax=Gadus morhua TaxID=8049 RepID=A0A8C4Z1P2_GADMO|nr:ADP-ribosylation factor-like protein 10 isoform X2 [Gadus morhua]